ncbi:MAG: 1-acyl-sn-glycerol-3-phosphate acyltransferase [Caldilineae bacterium]|nr:MAG: 1-acyl-sn-glycerol-3-phosphate acyltransferase [Caldilineae bacterium]
MITQQRLDKINLQSRPWVHVVLAQVVGLDYLLPRKTEIVLEGLEHLPKGKAVIFAMNHTDHFNYLPFMYKLYRLGEYPFVSPLVKGKYYEFYALGKLFDWSNCVPMPSRGYVISKDFQLVRKRRPTNAEYRLLRDAVDGKISADELLSRADDDLRHFLTTPHADFDPQAQPYPAYIEAKYFRMMQRVAQICEEALQRKNINILIFPQGTRSIRLLPGRIGLAQIALKTGFPVVPVGCNGSDKIYPDWLPLSRGGRVVYRIGEPLTLQGDLAPFAITEPFTPFTREAETKFRPQFQGATDLIMERINNLLDPPYQFAPDAEAIVGDGVRRFL